MAYESTEVTVSRSQEQIRNVLRKHGATRTNFGEDFTATADQVGTVGVEFVYAETLVRIFGRLRTPDPKQVKTKADRSRTKTGEQIADEMIEQEARRIWRVLHWAIKVRMEAIEEGLETFEEAFLPHLVDPASNATLWEILRPTVESGRLQVGGPGLPQLPALEAG